MMTVYIHIVVYGVYLTSDLLLTFKNDIVVVPMRKKEDCQKTITLWYGSD